MENLLYFDLYATKPTLFIKKQDSFRTYLGSFLTLITIIVIFLLFVFIVFCFTNDTGLSVLYDKTSKGMDNLYINLSKNIFFYQLNDEKNQKIDKRYLRTYPYLTTLTPSGIKYELLKEVKCNINEFIETDLQYDKMLQFDISKYNCIKSINDSDAVIQRKTNPSMNSYIILFMARCQNNSELNINDCFPKERIDKFIENNSIVLDFYLESVEVDHHNYHHPLSKKYYQNSLDYQKDFIFSYSFYWRKIEYFTRNTLFLFNYFFNNSTYILDTKIIDKKIYSANTNFHVENTIGTIEFLITTEYGDSYIRKYNTFIDSLTLLMFGFHFITNLCRLINYLFTKSSIYCTIFEPIITNSKTFNENFLKNTSIKFTNILKECTPYPASPIPSSSKIHLDNNNGASQNMQIFRLNNKTFPLKQIPSFGNNSEYNYGNINNYENIKNEVIRNILTDIQAHKISDNISLSDNFFFFFGKIFHSNNKKQMYLQRLEKVLQDELSLDYLFQEFKRIKLLVYDNMKSNGIDKWNILQKNQFSINVSSINNI